MIEIEDLTSIRKLVSILKEQDLTLRQVELMLTLTVPRLAEEVEQRIGMDRMTLKKITRIKSQFIVRRRGERATGQRGTPPVLYGLTEKGVSLLMSLNSELKGTA